MVSKAFLLFHLLVALLIIISQVAATDVHGAGKVTKETDGGEEAKHPDQYGGYPGGGGSNGGYGGPGGFGGPGGGFGGPGGGFGGPGGGFGGPGGGFGGPGGGFGGPGGGFGGPGGGFGGPGGGFGGPGGGFGRYCRYGCCYRGYYGRCLRCCYYAGEAAQTQPETKPFN